MQVLEEVKPALMAQLGIQSEVEWAEHTAAALDGFEDIRPVLEGRNTQVRVPRNHMNVAA